VTLGDVRRPRSLRTTAPPRTSLGRSSQRSPTAERRPRPPDLRRPGSYSVPFASATETRPGRALPMPSYASVSSRIRPANDRETSRNDGNGWSIESAGQDPDSDIGAGSEIGPDNTLKVETRVRTPLGLRGETLSATKFAGHWCRWRAHKAAQSTGRPSPSRTTPL
jgi:hypothetical protein